MAGEPNIDVLQSQMRQIAESFDGFTEIFREHCKQDEVTRTTVALLGREQESHCRDLTELGRQIGQLKQEVKLPWAAGMGGGGIAGLIAYYLPQLIAAIKGGP